MASTQCVRYTVGIENKEDEGRKSQQAGMFGSGLLAISGALSLRKVRNKCVPPSFVFSRPAVRAMSCRLPEGLPRLAFRLAASALRSDFLCPLHTGQKHTSGVR
jgi:hypothetical protein